LYPRCGGAVTSRPPAEPDLPKPKGKPVARNIPSRASFAGGRAAFEPHLPRPIASPAACGPIGSAAGPGPLRGGRRAAQPRSGNPHRDLVSGRVFDGGGARCGPPPPSLGALGTRLLPPPRPGPDVARGRVPRPRDGPPRIRRQRRSGRL